MSETCRFDGRSGVQNHVPTGSQLAQMLSHHLPQAPLHPVPFDGIPQRARHSQPNPAPRTFMAQGESHHQVQIPPATSRVNFTIIRPMQQADAFGEAVSFLGGLQGGFGRPTASGLLRGDSQAMASLPAASGQNFSSSRRLHPGPEAVRLGPLPAFGLISSFWHLLWASSSEALFFPVQ